MPSFELEPYSVGEGCSTPIIFEASAAHTPHERLRVAAMVDAAIAAIMGLSMADMRDILAECDHPNGAAPTQPKGFWRVDKDKPPELRQTVLTMLAFEALHQHSDGDASQGVASVITQHTDGWPLPETVCLADRGLGHDDHADQHQLVAGKLGARFFDWQLAQPTDETIRERRLHARNLLGQLDYARLLRDLGRPSIRHTDHALREVAEERGEFHVGEAAHDQSDLLE